MIRFEDALKEINLTNIAVIVCLTRVALVPTATIADALVLMFALFNLASKRNDDAQIKSTASGLLELEQKVEKMGEAIEASSKVVDEARQLINAKNLAGINSKKPFQL